MKYPILLLHGALGCSQQLVSLQEKLSLNHDVFVMDFEGHGNFNSEAEFSIHLFTENIISFLNERKIAKVNIFGFSMGGYVALNLAKNYPEFVGKIITLGTKFEWTPSFAQSEIKMLNAEIIQIKVPAFAKRLEKLHGIDNWKGVVLKTAKMMADLGDNPTLKATDYEKINQKTLICLGELDAMSTQAESKQVAEWLPNGIFQEIENLKHPIENAPVEKIINIINSFFISKDIK